MENRTFNSNQQPMVQGGQRPIPVHHMQQVPVNQNGVPVMQGTPINQQQPIPQRGQQPVQRGLPVRQSLPVRQGTINGEQRGGVRIQPPVNQPASVQVDSHVRHEQESVRGLPTARVSGSNGSAGKSKRGGINSGSYMTADEQANRMRRLLDYLQQVKFAKKSDIARVLGSHRKDTPRPLRTAMSHHYVQSLNDTGLTQAVYALTKQGNDMATYNMPSVVIPTNIIKLAEHTLGVARIASVLMSPDDDIPELWPNIKTWNRLVNADEAFLIGESLIQTSWRTVMSGSKVVTKNMLVAINQWMRDRQDGSLPRLSPDVARMESYRYVIPPYIVNSGNHSNVQYRLAVNAKLDGTPSFNPNAGERYIGYHVPDLVVSTVDNRSVAIEFERTPKTSSDYDDIILKMASPYATAIYGQIIWLATSNTIRNLIQRSIDKFAPITSHIKVYRVNTGRNPFYSVSNEIHAGA